MTRDKVDRIRIKRQITDLEQEILETKQQLIDPPVDESGCVGYIGSHGVKIMLWSVLLVSSLVVFSIMSDRGQTRLMVAMATPTAAPTDTSTPPSATATPSATPTQTVAPVALTVLNLADGDLAPYASSLLGTYPENQVGIIRVFVVPPAPSDGAPSNYYPQSYNHCQGNDGAAMQGGRWEQHILVGLPIEKDVGMRFDLVVTTATDAGNAAVAAEIQRWCDDAEKKWLGFPALPAGVEEVERITVIRSDELVRAPDPSNAPLPGALRISSPRDGQTVADEQVISGIYSGLPDGHAIWILVYTVWGKWLPQSSDACEGLHTVAENGQWQVTANFQTSYSGEPFDVVAVVADAEANAFFDQQQRQWCAQAAASPDFRWPGLLTIELPVGITEKDRIQLFHQ